MKYYLAHQCARPGETPLACLTSLGISEERAQLLIIEAAINRSDAIVIGGLDGDENKVLIVGRLPGSELWISSIGRVDELFDTREQAHKKAKEIDRQMRKMRKAGRSGSWFIVEWADSGHMRTKQ